MKLYKIIGVIFVIMSGCIYSVERGFSLLSSSIIRAGFFSGTNTGGVPEIEVNGFFSNFYVPLFLLVGLLLIIYGFKKKE